MHWCSKNAKLGRIVESGGKATCANIMQYFSYIDIREVLQYEYSQPDILPSHLVGSKCVKLMVDLDRSVSTLTAQTSRHAEQEKETKPTNTKLQINNHRWSPITGTCNPHMDAIKV